MHSGFVEPSIVNATVGLLHARAARLFTIGCQAMKDACVQCRNDRDAAAAVNAQAPPIVVLLHRVNDNLAIEIRFQKFVLIRFHRNNMQTDFITFPARTNWVNNITMGAHVYGDVNYCIMLQRANTKWANFKASNAHF